MSQMLPYLVKEVYQYQVTKTHAGSTASDRIVHISQCIVPQQRGCWLFQMLLITLLWSEQVGTSCLSIVLKSADLCLLNLCLSVQLHCQIQEKRREHLLLQLTGGYGDTLLIVQTFLGHGDQTFHFFSRGNNKV